MDLDQMKDIAETVADVLEVFISVFNWLNSNIFSRTGGLLDAVDKVVDFFSGLFGEGGFLSGLFSGEGFSLDSLGDLFGGLFG